jgi:hypothetical protein
MRRYAVTKLSNSSCEKFKNIHLGMEMDQQTISEHFDFCELISFRFYYGKRTVVVGSSSSFIYFSELENY